MTRKRSADPLHFRVENGSAYIADVPLLDGPMRAALDRLSDLRRRSVPSIVITPNVDQVLRLESDPEFFRIFRSADLLIADGFPVVALARLIGAPQVERLTGADLLPAVVQHFGPLGGKIVLLGGRRGVGELAEERLSAIAPGAVIRHVPFPFVDDIRDSAAASVIPQLREIDPDFVFVCLGSPKQEKWVSAWSGQLPPAVFIGAGAAIDFAAGSIRRAPVRVQRVGLEWLWRLVSEPRRLWRRYLVEGPRFLTIAVRSLRVARLSASASAASE